MIAFIKKSGNYLETYNPYGKRIAREYNKERILVYSANIVVTQDGNYIKVYDEDLDKISKNYLSFDNFLGAAGETFSVQKGNYIITYDKKGNQLGKTYIS